MRVSGLSRKGMSGLCVLLLVLLARPAAAQADSVVAGRAAPRRGPFIVGAYAQGSFIVAHTDAVRHLADGPPR